MKKSSTIKFNPTGLNELGNQRLVSKSVSLLFHGMVLLIASVSMEKLQRSGFGEAGGSPSLNMGLFVVDGADGGLAEVGLSPGAGDDEVTQRPMEVRGRSSTDAESLDAPMDTLPIANSDIFHSHDNLPLSTSTSEASTPTNLTGSAQAEFPNPRSSSDTELGSSEANTASVAGGAPRSGGPGGVGSTSFMGVHGVGTSVVYVVDVSSSMQGNRSRFAKAQLKASLGLLHQKQRFAVIFYSGFIDRVRLRKQDSSDLFFATEVNRRLACQEIDRTTSGQGTKHLPALLDALSLEPDVVYLLSDGEPELFAADLARIRRNTGKATIHTLLFSEGATISRKTHWMERLALQSNGEFRHVRPDP